MKFNKTGIEPEKAQALEVQKWTVDDCSRIFQIPPHKLGSMEYSKYNNVEQLQIDFVTQTMYYWFRKWESECNYKLFVPREQGRMFCEILVDGLLRGDIKSRYEAYNIGRQAGFLCVDDIREKENLNPLPDGQGQIFLEPLNMQPAGSEPNADDDDVRQAHRDLIADVFRRVITKCKKKGQSSENLPWAVNVLGPAVQAYGSLHRVNPLESRMRLEGVLAEYVSDPIQLQDEDAERFSHSIISILGGNNHANS
jgi:hypothetical protein